jgi:sodium/hydrogen antiporter
VSFLAWMALAGGLLLFMALSSAWIRNLPISTSAIYLVLGVAIGPLGLDWLRIDLREEVRWFERLTEFAVIVALFVGGLKLRLPLRDPAWVAVRRLGGPVMLVSIAGVAVSAMLLLGLNPATALLIGAVLAPTDPVLAGTVKVSNAGDHDRMRYGLSGEAGLNDGAAFPFVIFGLLWAEHGGAGDWITDWALHRLLWAVPAGLLLGFLLGRGVGRLAIWLRSHQQDTGAPSDFLALALIALSYVGAESIGAWGFLATFAAGVGLRHAELHVSGGDREVGAEPAGGRLGGRQRRGGGAEGAHGGRGGAGGGDDLVWRYRRAVTRGAAGGAGGCAAQLALGPARGSAGAAPVPGNPATGHPGTPGGHSHH